MRLTVAKVSFSVLVLTSVQCVEGMGWSAAYFSQNSGGQQNREVKVSPQRTVQQRGVQPEDNTGSLGMQSSAGNEQFRQQNEQDSEEGGRITLEEQLERLRLEMAELRKASSNKYPPAYGYSYPNGVDSVEFNQHVDPHTKKLQDQFIKEQQERNNSNAEVPVEKEVEYQVVLGLVNDAIANLSDFLKGNENRVVDEMLISRKPEDVADTLGKVLVMEMTGLKKITSELEGDSQGVEAKRKEVEAKDMEVDNLLAILKARELHLPEWISIDGKDCQCFYTADSFTNSRSSFETDAINSFKRKNVGSEDVVDGKELVNQCPFLALCLTDSEKKMIPFEIRKHSHDKGGIQADEKWEKEGEWKGKYIWEIIADSIKKRIFVYDLARRSGANILSGFFEYGKSYDDLKRVCQQDGHYQQLVKNK
ncbi:MAG: hypothetical protein J6S86_00670 [Alphaproteobacteria bacterium]|nr:hypothetical protein [Alphaproteobacteria bacterium]